MKKLLTILSLTAVGKAQGLISKEVAKGFTISMNYNAWSQVLTIRATIPSKTWFGLVIGSADHKNSDMIQMQAAGDNSVLFDAHSTGENKPIKDLKQDVSFRYENFSREVFFQMSRALDTGDPYDYLIKIGEEMTWGYALNDKTNNLDTNHTRTGSFKVLISTANDISQVLMYDFKSPQDFPTGPVPTIPNWPLIGFKDTVMLDNLDWNYIKSGGWTLDG